jgi:hypothetical protein
MKKRPKKRRKTPSMECWPSDFEPLGGNLFRVLRSIWFFPFGEPTLTMGQVVEAEPVSTGVWRYVRTHFKPAARSSLPSSGR